MKKFLVHYSCGGKTWTTYTTGDYGPAGSQDVLDHYHHGEPFTIQSVTEVPEGMQTYCVTSQFEGGYHSTDVFVAANVEDAVRHTYENWRAGLFLGGAVTSADVTINKIVLGENPCTHMEGLEGACSAGFPGCECGTPREKEVKSE